MLREWTLRSLIASLMLLTLVAVLAQVLLRYVTYQPIAWTEEFARFSFIWLCLLGAAEGARRSAHFAVDLLPRTLEGVPGRLFRGALNIVEASLYVGMASAGLQILPIVFNQYSVTLNMPMAFAYAAVPLGLGLMALFSILRARDEFAGRGESL